MEEEQLYNEELRAAVKHLYREEIIRQDKDIAEATGYSKSTISPYLKGAMKASSAFVDKFEGVYKLSLKNFRKDETANKNGSFISGHIQITAQQYVDQLQAEKKKAQEMVDILNETLNSNLAAMMQLLTTLRRHDLAYHQTMLKSLARIEGHKDDKLLISEADKREIEEVEREKKTGKNEDARM